MQMSSLVSDIEMDDDSSFDDSFDSTCETGSSPLSTISLNKKQPLRVKRKTVVTSPLDRAHVRAARERERSNDPRDMST